MKLMLLAFALVLFVLAGTPLAPDAWRVRLIAFGLAAWVATTYPF